MRASIASPQILPGNPTAHGAPFDAHGVIVHRFDNVAADADLDAAVRSLLG